MSAGPSWDDTEPVEQSGPSWDETEPVEGYVEKTVKNIIPDLKQTAIGIGSMIKEGAYEMPKRAMQTGVEMAGGVPYAETPSGRQAVNLVQNAPQQAAEMVRPITHPIDYMQEHPVQQTLNILGAKQLIGGMMPKKAPMAAPEMPMRTPEAPLPPPEAPMAARQMPKVAPEAPPVGAEPPPIPKAAPEPPPAAAKGPIDPLQDVKDFLKRTQAKAEAVPGWQEKAAKYVKNEVADFRAKDIGMRDPMIRSLDPKRPLQALQKAEDLMDYAGEKGYFRPGLTDVARKDAIASTIEKTGANIGAVRQIAGKRGTPPIAEIRKAILDELTAEYGEKAAREIKTVLSDFDRKVKENPTYQGMADLATYLNQEKKTFNKIGQNEGPTTDAANIVSRMNNDSLRSVLSPAENNFYTENLRDFGAHKKLEQMVASSARRAMTGRGAPGGAFSAIWQQLWDRGGYRMAGDVANRVSSSVLKNPGRIKSLPEFFEELAHHSGESFDELIGGMWQGGEVPEDVAQWVTSKNK